MPKNKPRHTGRDIEKAPQTRPERSLPQTSSPKEDVSLIPKEEAVEARLAILMQQLNIYSSSVIPTDELRQLEEMYPGSIKIVLEQVTKQGEHRMWMEKNHLQGDQRLEKWGIVAAVIVVFLTLTAAVIFAFLGQGGAAAIASVGGITALAGTFLYATSSRKDERIKRARIMTGRPDGPDKPQKK
ncbi:MAG TPA: hypothetical protein VGE45_20095 [Chloroflexia bacterium]|jgi:uncharacterized membrane protein